MKMKNPQKPLKLSKGLNPKSKKPLPLPTLAVTERNFYNIYMNTF